MRPRHVSARLLLLALALGLATAPPLTAQRKASERARTVQRINGTWITVDYSRPGARGRDNLFGGVVHWDDMWTPGANWATTIETDGEIRIEGHLVPEGAYSIWLEVKEGEEWTMHLLEETSVFHDEHPEPDQAWLSFPVTHEEAGSHMEALAWYFPEVSFDRAELRMHWGSTYVPLSVEVTPWESPSLTPAQLAAYTGRYRIEGAVLEEPLEVEVVVGSNGRLRVRMPEGGFDLAPFALHGFYDVTYRDGQDWELGIENPWYFVVQDGAVTGLEMYLDDGRLVLEGPRIG